MSGPGDAPEVEWAPGTRSEGLDQLKIYAHCIDGQATAANQRIADALGLCDAEPDLGDEGDGDTEQTS